MLYALHFAHISYLTGQDDVVAGAEKYNSVEHGRCHVNVNQYLGVQRFVVKRGGGGGIMGRCG